MLFLIRCNIATQYIDVEKQKTKSEKRKKQINPQDRSYKLEQNYRSSEHIVNAANQIIKNNQLQLPKQIWTDIKGGEKIKIYMCLFSMSMNKLI